MAQIGSDAQIICEQSKASAITEKAGYLCEPAVMHDNAGLISPRCLSPRRVVSKLISSTIRKISFNYLSRTKYCY